ncbi:MAG: Peptidoglycan hydrolase FlgJ [Pseudomonadota bacterium]|jgi:Rod binding domain-containing protein
MDTSLTSTVDTTLSSYNDFQSLGRLKGAAAQDPKAALRSTAEQFEAHFIQHMLQVMRETIDKSELTTNNGLETYEGMFDKEVALQMTKRGGIGLADMLEKHMTPPPAAPDALPASQALQLRANPAQVMPLTQGAASSLPMPDAPGTKSLPVPPVDGTVPVVLPADSGELP